VPQRYWTHSQVLVKPLLEDPGGVQEFEQENLGRASQEEREALGILAKNHLDTPRVKRPKFAPRFQRSFSALVKHALN